PHRYTRTRDRLAQFAPALSGADVVVLTDIYAAGEPAIPGVTAEAILETCPTSTSSSSASSADGPTPARHVPRAALAAELARLARPGDMVLVLGAGDITNAAGELLALIGDKGLVSLARPRPPRSWRRACCARARPARPRGAGASSSAA